MNERRYEIVLMDGDKVITRYATTLSSHTSASIRIVDLNKELDQQTYPLAYWKIRENLLFSPPPLPQPLPAE